MASTLTELLYHCIWSTKNRERLITLDIEGEVWRILVGTANHHGMHVIKAGGIEDHVHVLVRIPKTLALSEAMKQLKGGSSKCINDEKLIGDSQRFAWQDGYGAFTVSKSNVPAVTKYIAEQRKHHQGKSFKEELIEILERHGVDYDPTYLWT